MLDYNLVKMNTGKPIYQGLEAEVDRTHQCTVRVFPHSSNAVVFNIFQVADL